MESVIRAADATPGAQRTAHGSRGRWKTSRIIRVSVQIVFFLAVALSVLTRELALQGINLPLAVHQQFHFLCPFGGVATIGRWIAEGRFIPKTGVSNLWMLAASLGSTVLFGAFFCGWLCPLGSVQEWIGRLGRKLLGKRYNKVPRGLDRVLGYLRYGMLALVLFMTASSVSLAFSKYDPYYALFNIWSGDAALTAVAILAFVLLLSLFVERPWCRWLCPFGAVQGILSLVAPWKIRRRASGCSDCGACSKTCPMGIDVAHATVVRDTRCNRCGQCLSSCSRESCLELRLPGTRRLRLTSPILRALIVILLFVIPMLIGIALGDFTHGKKHMSESPRAQETVQEIGARDLDSKAVFKESEA